MTATESSTKWMDLTTCDCVGTRISIATGMDKNNYICIDRSFLGDEIYCIYKYNIDIDKWTKIDGFNGVENISAFSATLDIKKQILFLCRQRCLTQIQLNNNHIRHDNHTTNPWASESIVVNNSLFFVGGHNNNSVLKWDSKKKTFIKWSDMYNKMHIGLFSVIYNNKNNCLLLFGG
eukprot:278462_1